MTRISNTMQLNMFLSSLSTNQSNMIKTQEQISTLMRINRPSDDPIGANLSMELQLTLERSAKYQTNAGYGSNILNIADSALGDLNDIMTTARTIMLREEQSIDPATRRSSAIEVDGLLNQAISLANTKFGDRHIFGGFNTTEDPFSIVGDAVLYRGDESEQFLDVSASISIAINMTGSTAFGALTSEVQGNVDLNPTIASATKLADLNAGAGITSGSIQVGDGVTTTTIDLSTAENLGDVVDIINNDPAGIVTATLTGTGVTLTGGTGSIFVREVNNGRTASDLGVFQQALTAGPMVGGDLDPSLTQLTLLSQLNGGTGLTDLTTDVTITNGTASATFDFTGATTMQDILRTINNSDTFVQASINNAGTGIDVTSRLNGARLNIADAAGGVNAAELGIQLSFSRMRLVDMNAGKGVASSDGNDFQVTLTNGDTIQVDISNAVTIQDVLDLINNDVENGSGFLTASVVPGANQIQLVDTSGGTGDLIVNGINGSFAADGLGILGSDASGTLTGSDLSPAGFETDSLFSALAALKKALNDDDTQAIARAGLLIDQATDILLDARAEVGARGARLELTSNRLADEELQLTNLLTETRSIDLTEAIVRLQDQQVLFQANLATAALVTRTSLLDFL